MSALEDYALEWRRGSYLGAHQATTLVEYRLGRLKHGYAPWTGPPIGARVAGGYIRNPGDPTPSGWPIEGYGRLYWQNTWTPEEGDDGVFAEMPNVLEWGVSQSFQSNGIAVLTLQVDNIAYPEIIGPGGAYHSIKRGYYAPKRGDHAPSGPPLMERGQPIAANEWYGKFNSGGQIKVWHGYGDLLIPVGVFLVDDIDSEDHPDRITITARDYGQTLTDMRVFGWNKEPRILDPVIFIDRLKADKVKKVGHSYRASASHADHPIENVADHDSDTYWLSDGHNSGSFTVWMDLKVPEGRYEDFYMFPRQAGMEAYVSVFAKNQENGPPTLDGHVIPEGWVDTGHGNVPGANGGIPFIHHRQGLAAKGVYMGLRGVFHLGKGSVIRVHFRHLRRRSNGNYYGSCNRFFANKRSLNPEASKKHWVLIDDVADMVKVALRWAGFKEWDVESTGVRLKERYVVPRAHFYMDLIKAAQDLTGYIFYMRPPTDNPDSIGIPCFRRPLVVDPRIQPRALVRDSDLLTGIETKETDEPRAYIIRARGKTAKEQEGGERLGGDKTKRLMYEYRPPWWRRLGGIVKHVVHTNNGFKTTDDVKFACLYIALQEALEADKATCQLPIHVGLELDSHLAVLDVGTGLMTRLWISDLQLQFRRSEQPVNTMSVGGALSDTADIRQITHTIDTTPRGSEH